MAFTEIDEKLLVRAYQAGDERAFDTIVRTQYNALYAHALRRLSSHESAEDAVQDTMLRAYRALPNLDGDLALRAWLHRILTNVCHDEGNRRRRQHGLVEKIGALPEELADDPVEEAVLHDTVRVMTDALKDLPESYREALVLRYVDGLSFREVAEATGVSEENARARVHRGRHALRKVLSRIAVLAAFIIPGLKRTQTAPAGSEQAATTAIPDHVSLVTQLTAHGVNAAPSVGRLAEVASMTSGKSALATAAVAAVAAVGVTGGAVAVNEARKPERPPAQVAAPAEAPRAPAAGPSAAAIDAGDIETGGDGDAGVGGDAATTTSTSTSTTEPLPRSALAPFEGSDATEPSSGSTSTTSTTSTTAPPSAPPVASIEGSFSAEHLVVTGTGPNVDVAGPVTLVGDQTRRGELSGRVTIHDDGFASAELTVTVDGKAHDFSYRGNVVERTDEAGVTVWHLTGKYRMTDANSVGLAEMGDLTGWFRRGDGDTGALRLELSGPASESSQSSGGSATAEPAPDDDDPKVAGS